MRFGFVTCVQLGLSCMQQIVEIGCKLSLAITLKDEQAQSKSGRVYLDEFCSRNSTPLLKTNHINETEVISAIRKYKIDWLFIIGWSQIAGKQILNAPKHGVLGAHPTLLPIGRGRASIPWAIIKRLDKTGVTLFKLDEGVDTGPIVDQIEIPLTPKMNATLLYELVNSAHIELIRKAVPRLEDGLIKLNEQNNSLATEWPGRTPQDGQIDLGGSVHDAECLVRATTDPYPGAFVVTDGRKIRIWEAEIADVPGTGSDLCLTFPDGYLSCLNWEVIN